MLNGRRHLRYLKRPGSVTELLKLTSTASISADNPSDFPLPQTAPKHNNDLTHPQPEPSP